jgi:hypothetical protein
VNRFAQSEIFENLLESNWTILPKEKLLVRLGSICFKGPNKAKKTDFQTCACQSDHCSNILDHYGALVVQD